MIGLLLCLVSTAVTIISAIVVLLNCDEYGEPSNKFIWIHYLSFFVVCFCIFGECYKDFQPSFRDAEPYSVQYLYSLEDNNLTNGRGYARRVRIETDLYYQYMYKSGDGYNHGKIKAERTTVYEDDRKPRVEFYKIRKKWFIFENTRTVYHLYVPAETIQKNFNIDLE